MPPPEPTEPLAKGKALEQGKDNARSMGHQEAGGGGAAAAIRRLQTEPDKLTTKDLNAIDRELCRIRDKRNGGGGGNSDSTGAKCKKCCGFHKDGVKQAKWYACQKIGHIGKSTLCSKKKNGGKARKVDKDKDPLKKDKVNMDERKQSVVQEEPHVCIMMPTDSALEKSPVLTVCSVCNGQVTTPVTNSKFNTKGIAWMVYSIITWIYLGALLFVDAFKTFTHRCPVCGKTLKQFVPPLSGRNKCLLVSAVLVVVTIVVTTIIVTVILPSSRENNWSNDDILQVFRANHQP